MGYTVIKSFERGIDTRRMIDTTEVGGLLDAKDCHITRGGEVEKRPSFVVKAQLPPNSIGLHVAPGPVFHVFGTDPAAVPPSSLPSGGVYHQIPDPAGQPLSAILCVEEFQTKLYVIAQYAPVGAIPGRVLHWWGGTHNGGADMTLVTEHIGQGGDLIPPDESDPPIVVDPPPVGQTGASPTTTFNLYFPLTPANAVDPADPAWKTVILQYAWLLKPGSKYKFSGSTQDAWTLVTPTGTDSQGKPYTGIVIPNTVQTNIALGISDEINKGPAAAFGIKFYGKANGTQLSVYADESSTRFNGWTVQLGGRFQCFPDYKNIMSGGLDRATAALLSGAGSVFPRAEGDPDPPMLLGTYVCAHDQKLYATNTSKLNFCKITDPMRWDVALDAPGAGYIEMDTIAEGTPLLIALADFSDGLALFGLRHVMIWHMDPDPDLNFQKQILHRTGLVAPHAQVPFGEGEVIYIDRSGIRSLRTRSGVDQAYAADMGTLIDPLIRAKIANTAADVKFRHWWAEVEPTSGRLWMGLHDIIYVLSYYPANHVSAWTYYDCSAHPIDYLNATDDQIFWRSGNDLISFGGDDGQTYDAIEAVVRIPYVTAEKPASVKNWEAIDAALQGTWQIKASFDPTQPNAMDLLANVTKSTYAQQKIAMNGQSPSVSLEFRTTTVGPARLGNAAVHYEGSFAD